MSPIVLFSSFIPKYKAPVVAILVESHGRFQLYTLFTSTLCYSETLLTYYICKYLDVFFRNFFGNKKTKGLSASDRNSIHIIALLRDKHLIVEIIQQR